MNVFLRVVGLVGLVALVGCADLGIDTPSIGISSEPLVGTPTLSLLSNEIVAVGPNGYCADLQASIPRRGFAFFVHCKTLDETSEVAAFYGVATVQVGAKDSALITGSADEFVAFLESDAGAATLSRELDAATVDVQSTRPDPTAVSVRFTDSAPSDVAGELEMQWRAFVDIKGRLVTISVRSLKEAPLDRAAGSAMLRQALRAIIAANTQNPPSEG